MDDPIICLSGVEKKFGSFTALKDITFDIGRGEFFSLLGASGCGKTTLLRILAGIEQPTRGELTIDGKPMSGVPANRRPTNMVFQSYAIFPHLSVRENISYGLVYHKLTKAEAQSRTDEAIELVKLSGLGERSAHQLSGGQRQRVALARALVCRPKVLLLDEPLSALDKKLREEMQQELRSLQRTVGITFVFVTHDQEEALALSSRVAIFEKGRLQQVAPPREVYERPANRFVAEFLGDINILPVQDGRIEGRPVEAARESGDLAIRPEYMQLSLTEPGGGNAVAAVLDDITYLGAETRLSLRSAGGVPLVLHQQTARLPESIAPGSAVWATWAAADGFLL